MVTTGVGQLLQKLHLVLLLNPVHLSQLIKFLYKGIDDLHTFEQFRTAILITPILIAFSLLVLGVQICNLVLHLVDVPLFASEVTYFLPQLI